MRPSPFPVRQRGFSLVELSIVMVIIGLIIAGVMSGQELIQSSKLQNIAKQAGEIRDAINTFRQKYGDLPGDMPDATTYWSSCTDLPTNPCNGNGNGQIWETLASNFLSERYRLWQHLSLSGIFPGKYTGDYSAGTIIGTTVPGGVLPSSYWLVGWWQELTYSNNFIRFTTTTSTPPLTSVEMRSIDQKYDDGLAYSGRVLGISGGPSLSCPAYNGAGTTTDYDVSRTGKECSAFFNWVDLKT